jgi:two-component system OmpR family response regulator
MVPTGREELPEANAVRILVVEDEPDLLGALRKSLRDEGYAVDVAEDGEEGLYKATAWDYDAVILDIMLPKGDGWEVLRRIRRSKKIPVLMLTARDTVEDRIRGLDGGADDYLVKPFEIRELLARLRALIRRSAGQARAMLEIGDVAIDTASRTVKKAGHEVPLTAREYTLLEHLALHRGQLVSRADIYEHLFDENDDTVSKIVEVHVSNIRKKLGKNLIATRRGLGYIIDGDV